MPSRWFVLRAALAFGEVPKTIADHDALAMASGAILIALAPWVIFSMQPARAGDPLAQLGHARAGQVVFGLSLIPPGSRTCSMR